ncbi:hypothetical protein JIN86_04825 [Lysinibacillus sp. HST-98]|uniref:hypothetical protein n=1 Tax=Lysinibacillus sp. HST-98 TaxID=2800419 RepID=UPI001925BB84|nr:hypothetical protein [Lysinibacillus sp. HST-98]MBL3728933.1 hypothetical protein [Lysinibacillus sp. HST-98]
MGKFKFTKGNLCKNNPYPLETHHERLIKDKAIDMRDNYRIIHLDNGYVQIKPIDESIFYKE